MTNQSVNPVQDAPSGAPSRKALLALFGALGAASIITQTVLLREMLALLQGTELLVGLTLALWLVGIALGSPLGGKLGRRLGRGRLAGLTELAVLAVVLLPLGQVPLLALGRSVLDVPPGLAVPPGAGVGLLTVCLLPYTFLIGLLFPLGARLLAPAPGRGEGPASVGALYAAEAAGALAGGLLYSLVLAGRIGSLAAAALAGALLLTVLGWTLTRRRGLERRVALGLCAALAALAALGATQVQRLDPQLQRLRLEALAPRAELVDSFDTAYGSMLLARQAEQLTLYEDGVPTVSFPDPYRDGPRAASLLVQHPRPRRVCLLGGGAAGLVSQLLSAGMQRVVVVVQDGALLERLALHLPQRDLDSLSDERVSLVVDDPRRYLYTADERFDLLAVIQPDPATVTVNRFYTREFLRLAADRLATGGVLALTLHGGANVLGPEAADLGASVWRTMRQVFEHVLPLPGQPMTLVASQQQGALTTSIDILDQRLEMLPGRVDSFTAPQLQEVAPQGRIDKLLQEMMKRQVGVNLDLRPLAPMYHLLLWASRDRAPARAEDPATPVLDALRSLARSDQRLPGLAALLLLLPLVLVLRRGSASAPGRAGRVRCWLTLGLLGAASMALEVSLLLAFQQRCGSLYQMVALLVASFMAGLALGGGWMARRLDEGGVDSTRRRRIFSVLGLVLLLLGSTLPLLLGGLSPALPQVLVHGFFVLLLLAAGAVTGVAFPLTAHELLASAEPPDREQQAGAAAAFANSVDHAGAALGAAVTGTVLLPLFGVQGVSLGLGVLGAALMVLWLEWR